MNILKRIGMTGFFCMILCISILLNRSQAQQRELTQLPADINRNGVLVPVFTERESDVGSPYLSNKWIRGNLVLWSDKRIPGIEQQLLFNFDKIHSRVYVLDQSGKQWFYPIDSLKQFELFDYNVVYTFLKLPMISLDFFLIPVIQSEKGYSLYKRLLTKCTRSSYENAGYYSTGNKYDEYLDYNIYYLVYPGNTSYRKLYLNETKIRRAFRDESVLLDRFFDFHDNEISEESLLAMVQYINEKKFPE